MHGRLPARPSMGRVQRSEPGFRRAPFTASVLCCTLMRLLSVAVIGIYLGSLPLLLSSEALAQTSKAAATQADKLFREARGLLEQGRYREACRTFERSQELDPSPGTLLNLGNCYEQEGDLAHALATFERAVADSQLQADAKKRKAWVEAGSLRRDSLRSRVPMLKVKASPTPGVSVTLDGQALAQLDSALRLNSGHHVVEASGPGKMSFRRELDLQLADDVEVVLPALSDAAPIAPTEPPAPSAPPAGPVTARAAGPSAWPWVCVGGGAALLVAGTVTGIMAKSKENQLDAQCSSEPCDPSLRDVRDSGEHLALATYLLWAAGGATAAVGLTLFALDDGPAQSTEVSAGCFGPGCGLFASGHF
jgi:tetratricopeptide (TPR) repeat protein